MADKIVSWGGIDSKGTTGMGVTGSLSISGGPITPTSNIARGAYFNNTITSTSNSDVVIGLDINPIFSGNNSDWHTLRLWQPINEYGDKRPYMSWKYGDQYDVFRMYMDANWRTNFKNTGQGGQRGFAFSGGNVEITGSTSNSLLVKGSGTTSSTTSFLVQDSSGNSAFQIKDDRSATIYGPLNLSRANQGFIYYSANDYIAFPRQGGAAPGYFSTSTAGDGWAFTLAANSQTYARIMEGSFYLEAYTPSGNGRNSIKTWFSGSNFVYIDGDGVTGRSPSYGNGVNVIIRGGKSGTYENVDNRGAAGYVTVEGGSAYSGSSTTHVPAAGVNIQTGLGLGTGSAADLTFSTSTTSSVASTYHTQTQRMVIKGQTGNVGIGTNDPKYILTNTNATAPTGYNGFHTLSAQGLYWKNTVSENDRYVAIFENTNGYGDGVLIKGSSLSHSNFEIIDESANKLFYIGDGFMSSTIAAFNATTTAFNIGGTYSGEGLGRLSVGGVGTVKGLSTFLYSNYGGEKAITFRNNSSGELAAISSTTDDLNFYTKLATGNFSSSDIRMRIASSTGNILINTTTDSGGKLTVKGSGTTTSTKTLLLQNSSNTQLGYVDDSGRWMIGSGTNGGFTLDVGGTTQISSTSGGYKLTLKTTGGGNGAGLLVDQNGYTMLDVGANDVYMRNFPSNTAKLDFWCWNNYGGPTNVLFAQNSQYHVSLNSPDNYKIPIVKFPDATVPIIMGNIATSDIRGYLTVGGTFYASASLGASQRIVSTVSAVANNDTLIGLDILPTFSTGSYTGVTNLALRVSGSATISNILTLTPQSPLPSGVPTGSFAVSSSAPPKPYFYDGTTWNALY